MAGGIRAGQPDHQPDPATEAFAAEVFLRHDVSRKLIRVWIAKYEASAFDDEFQAADLLQQYEAKIAALERLVGRQALEIEFLKGAQKNAPSPRSARTSVVAGPVECPSPKDAG